MKKMIGAALMMGLAAGLVPVTAWAQDNTAAQAQQGGVAIAPYNWKSVAIIGGGFVSGIITHPGVKGVMYARTDVGGAYRFDAAAKRWIPITDWVPASEWTYTGIESMAVDPTDANVVYMAAGTYTNNWAPQNGAIFRSSDQGRTWKKTMLPFKNGGNENGRNIGERLMVDPNQPATIYFGSRNNGLWKSTDNGASFEQVASFPVTGRTNGIGIGYVLFDAGTGAKGIATPTIYVGVAAPGAANLYRSTDAGKSWAPVQGQPKGLLPHHAALDRDGSLYLTYGNNPGPNEVTGGAVWKLDTRSGQWTEISPVKPSDSDKFGYAGVSVDAQKPGTLVVSSLDRWARGDDVWRSTDGGKTWIAIRANQERQADIAPHYGGKDGKDFGHWMGDIEIDPFDSGHAMYVTGMGIWATDDLTAHDKAARSHWYPGAVGIEECVVNDLASPPAGAPLISVMWDIAGFRHENLDQSPKARSFGWGRNVSIDFAELKPEVMVRLYGAKPEDKAGGGAYSLDNGVSWTPFAANPGGDGVAAVAADGSVFVVAPENGEAKFTKDMGKTWAPAAGLPAKARVVADRVNAATFYGLAQGQLFVSTDSGASFTPKGSVTDGYLRAVPGQQGHLWVAGGQGLFRSTDGGASFAPVGDVQSGHRIGFGKPAEGKSYPALYLVGQIEGTYGIFRSDDEGANWVRINDDQHQFGSLNAITGDPRVYGRVYIASSNRGVLYAEPAR